MKATKLVEIENKIAKKCKDGVYTYQSTPYVVINKRLRFLGDFENILEMSYGFMVIIGKCEYWELRSKLNKLFKEHKIK